MSGILSDIKNIVGNEGILSDHEVANRSAGFWSSGPMRAKALVRPSSTQEVSQVLALCNEQGQTVVVVGGATGLAGAHITKTTDIALSLERMQKIGLLNEAARYISVEAGAVLQSVQDAVAEKNFMLGVDLGARGSCTIGGNIATNAGGNRVVRYGMMRDQVLGLEVVLADGTVVSSMNRLVKNNTGYDLRQLFIGAEGTLGIVTNAVLKLHDAPKQTGTALLCIPSWDAVLETFRYVNRAMEGRLVAFEVMWKNFFDFNTGKHAKVKRPLDTEAPYYVILETFGFLEKRESNELEDLMISLYEKGWVVDGLITKSEKERRLIWDIRENFDAELSVYGHTLSYDISLPQNNLESFTDEVIRAISKRWPEAVVFAFGHLGDGNLHYSVANVAGELKAEVDQIIYGLLEGLHGSISAEHGIGIEKKLWLHISRTQEEIAMMRRLKKSFDPKNIMNPGKIFDMPAECRDAVS